MSQEILDISTSVVRLDLAPRYKHGTLYQMAVKVPPKKTVKYVVKSLRLLERQESKYRCEVQSNITRRVVKGVMYVESLWAGCVSEPARACV
ncbi:hypothetical protein RRG08_047541 [Elysia crispata]|uniref:Uncharacterized protein n=1 Tax=Elysia crispata TaxID=231223 RepID=A0AAE0YP41_9GAST|nr:hypothetical protein RRG08_047541 [Elysia crispata]